MARANNLLCKTSVSGKGRPAVTRQLHGMVRQSCQPGYGQAKDLMSQSQGINRTAASTPSCQLSVQVRLSPSLGQMKVSRSGTATLFAKRIRAPVSEASIHTPSARPFGGQVKRHGAHAFCLCDLRLPDRSKADDSAAAIGLELFNARSIRDLPIPGGFFPNITSCFETSVALYPDFPGSMHAPPPRMQASVSGSTASYSPFASSAAPTSSNASAEAGRN